MAEAHQHLCRGIEKKELLESPRSQRKWLTQNLFAFYIQVLILDCYLFLTRDYLFSKTFLSAYSMLIWKWLQVLFNVNYLNQWDIVFHFPEELNSYHKVNLMRKER